MVLVWVLCMRRSDCTLSKGFWMFLVTVSDSSIMVPRYRQN